MAEFLDNKVAAMSLQAEGNPFLSTFPPEHQSIVTVGDITTQILCSSFSDNLFIVITQLDKFGTILKATSIDKIDGGQTFHVQTLMGKRDDPLLIVYARQLVERLRPYTSKPIILSIALKDEGRGRDVFEAVVNKVLETAVW